ncbi:MAG: hypothetical protein NWE82_03400 [Candidatus Bathyarchaeota archaeon]|nr:hypothetical protein [Candidatus Bathyarchaeota archaeon]
MPSLKMIGTVTPPMMIITLTAAAAVPVPASDAVTKLSAPCHRVIIRILPPVLLYSHVRIIAPAMIPTAKNARGQS